MIPNSDIDAVLTASREAHLRCAYRNGKAYHEVDADGDCLTCKRNALRLRAQAEHKDEPVNKHEEPVWTQVSLW